MMENVILLILLGIFLINYGASHPVGVILFVFFIISFISMIVVYIKKNGVMRSLSLVNGSLKEAWIQKNNVVHPSLRECYARGRSIYRSNRTKENTRYEIQSINYMINGLNHELVLLGKKDIRGMGDSIVPTFIWCIISAFISTLVFLVWIMSNFANFEPEAFKSTGLGVAAIILASGIFLSAIPYNVAWTLYTNKVNKIYEKLAMNKINGM